MMQHPSERVRMVQRSNNENTKHIFTFRIQRVKSILGEEIEQKLISEWGSPGENNAFKMSDKKNKVS